LSTADGTLAALILSEGAPPRPRPWVRDDQQHEHLGSDRHYPDTPAFRRRPQPLTRTGLNGFITATEAMIGCGGNERPRYVLQLDEQLAAIIQTADDELGQPDHAGAADLLAQLADPKPVQRLAITRTMSGARTSTRRILPEMVLGSSANSIRLIRW
jgi:hypothetical protein